MTNPVLKNSFFPGWAFPMNELEPGGKSLSPLQSFFLKAINFVPLRLRVWFFERMGLLLYILDGRHRRIAHRNLALAFPDCAPRKLAAIARSVFRNLGRVLAEFTFIPRLDRQNVERHIWLEGTEYFIQAQKEGKGVLFLTAHFGNWEWMAASFPFFMNRSCYVVVRPLDDAFSDGLVEGLRTWTGNKTVSKQKSMGRLLRLLKSGETLGILLDQNVAWQEGVFVNFFGELACTNVGLALLALKTGAPVLPTFNIRQPDGRYRIVIEPPLPLIRTGDKNLDVEENTAQYMAVIERYVRNYPDHWFWIHQRWKTRPWQAKLKNKDETRKSNLETI
jgi:Kdo2-lipid IVA lauroyltransferase/acyltransferase